MPTRLQTCATGLLILFSSVATAQAGDVDLPTLFYTPAERSAIAAARVSPDSSSFNFNTSVSVTGLVKRGQAKSTVWLNGKTLREGEAAPSGNVPRIGKRSVGINDQELRVGETVDLDSGSRTDYLPDGSVSSRRQK